MRDITHGDICAAARVLVDTPRSNWDAETARLLTEAEHADRYRRGFGIAHPRLGNGTLMAAALARAPAPAPPASDLDYLAALAAVIEAVLDWRSGERV